MGNQPARFYLEAAPQCRGNSGFSILRRMKEMAGMKGIVVDGAEPGRHRLRQPRILFIPCYQLHLP
jgi:hypothetical protein